MANIKSGEVKAVDKVCFIEFSNFRVDVLDAKMSVLHHPFCTRFQNESDYIWKSLPKLIEDAKKHAKGVESDLTNSIAREYEKLQQLGLLRLKSSKKKQLLCHPR